MSILKIWFKKINRKNEEKRIREQEAVSKKIERLLSGKKIHDEFIAEWDEKMKSIKIGSKVRYLGVRMMVVSVRRPSDYADLERRGSSYGVILCEYVDKNGKFQSNEFLGSRAFMLSNLEIKTSHEILKPKP